MNAQVDVMLSVLSISACYAGRTYDEYYSPLSPDWHSSAGSSRPEPGLHCNPGRLRYHRYRRPPALSSLPRAPEAAFAWRHCAHFGTPLARFVAP